MKIVLVGNINVGKSSFFVRFKEGRFEEVLKSTIGLDQCTKEITLSDGKTVKINLWDTAGLEVAGYMTSNYYRFSKGVVLMYDVKDRDTLNCLNSWIDDSKPYIPDQAPFFLLGNKIDSFATEIEITKQDAVNFAKNNKIPEDQVFEISVKSGKGFKNFIDSVANILSRDDNHVVDNAINLRVENQNNQNKLFGCC
ncbi:ras-related protein RabC-like [Hydra vulgaris]|uniref:Ras-related protein RabC-like n=1 Tax=Hydra vulgaris TaxID=6087 RepID=A0ABM4DJW4_HYDVU